MKKLIRKRALAYIIDVFVFTFFYELFRKFVAGFIPFADSWEYFVFVIPFVLRDVIFHNGSLGKKIVGLVVVDDKWEVPSVGTLIKRAAVTSLGHVLLCRFRVLGESWEKACFAQLDWEYSRLKARVVEKKVFKALKEKAVVDGTIDIAKMEQLYENYLYSE